MDALTLDDLGLLVSALEMDHRAIAFFEASLRGIDMSDRAFAVATLRRRLQAEIAERKKVAPPPA